MQIETNILKTDLLYNSDKSKRYTMHIEWDKKKKNACIIMLSAGYSNGLYFDKTTNCVLKNLVDLDYGTVDILNLFSNVNGKKEDSKDKENLNIISDVAKAADIVIFAVGTGHKTNKKISERQKEVLTILKKYDKKLYCIADHAGQKFYHPLCPKVYEWNLVKFDVEELTRKGYEND